MYKIKIYFPADEELEVSAVEEDFYDFVMEDYPDIISDLTSDESENTTVTTGIISNSDDL